MLARLRMTTAGESHGPGLLGILEGLPAGVPVDEGRLQHELDRRRQGYGRSVRMRKEHDRVRFLSGIREGRTLGSPIGAVLDNEDHKERPPFSTPRPGHADLAGMRKLSSVDARPVLERASARETAMRVALGALCRELLRAFGIHVGGHVLAIGGERSRFLDDEAGAALHAFANAAELANAADASPVASLDEDASARMVAAIDRAKAEGDTLGGVFEVLVSGVPAGLGSYAHWDRRLDARLSAAVMSVPALKGVEVGEGFRAAFSTGASLHDLILPDGDGGVRRPTNRAGGLEGGMSNGEPLVIRAAMKPLPTLMRPLPSVDLSTGEAAPALLERSDVCAVAAARVVTEAMVSVVVADALLEKLGGDSLEELRAHWNASFGARTNESVSLDDPRGA